MLRGDIRGAVRYMTEQEKGRVFQPQDVDANLGNTVAEVLADKHPNARIPDVSDIHAYESTPDFPDNDVTVDTLEKVARRQSGSAGFGGVDSHAVQKWRLRFGGHSAKLQTAVSKTVEWSQTAFHPGIPTKPSWWGVYVGKIKGQEVVSALW